MNRASIYFTAPRALEARQEALAWHSRAASASGQVLVKTICSAISAGTELLIYRGEAPADLPADETILALGGGLGFPLKYGYSAVGRVVELGPEVSAHWQDKLVFAFNPHETYFVARAADLILLPDDLAPEAAIFLPNVETAVNFLHDGAPLVGERVGVFGQGVVGLLTTALLARLPLASLTTFDCFPQRRRLSLSLGASQSIDPDPAAALPQDALPFDLAYELSGSPAGLDQAVALTGYNGRVVIGSWYGAKRVSLDLGGRFHRSRISLISSQVSTIHPALRGRWTKQRQLELALRFCDELNPTRLITHRLPFHSAPEAYALLDQSPEAAVQVILDYD